MRLRIQLTGECTSDCDLVDTAYLGLCGSNDCCSGAGGAGGAGSYDPEIIFIVNEDGKIIEWTDLRKSKYGVFPIVQCWLEGPGGVPYLTSQQPVADAPPPDFTQMTFSFTGPENGWLIITK